MKVECLYAQAPLTGWVGINHSRTRHCSLIQSSTYHILCAITCIESWWCHMFCPSFFVFLNCFLASIPLYLISSRIKWWPNSSKSPCLSSSPSWWVLLWQYNCSTLSPLSSKFSLRAVSAQPTINKRHAFTLLKMQKPQVLASSLQLPSSILKFFTYGLQCLLLEGLRSRGPGLKWGSNRERSSSTALWPEWQRLCWFNFSFSNIPTWHK